MIPKRIIVLDTNVCLDLFVFRDARWNLLLAALRSGEVEAVTRADCRMEWLIVLNYPYLPLDDISKARSIVEFDALVTCLPAEIPSIPETRLPICKDPDDQKFLELARDAHAHALITKDKALLKLAKKTVRAGLFLIMCPETWVQNATAGNRGPQ